MNEWVDHTTSLLVGRRVTEDGTEERSYRIVSSFLPPKMSLVQPIHLICCSNHVPAPSTLGSPHDNHILYPIIKVLYALHTLLERIAASKTLESPRGEGGVMNKEGETGRWREMTSKNRSGKINKVRGKKWRKR